MKRIITKIHHFTRQELAVEEIIIVVLITLLATTALAASVIIPIRATIVQCGSRAERCREDRRCCALLEMTVDSQSGPNNAAITGSDDKAAAGHNTPASNLQDIDVEHGAESNIE
jgi:hypothetical protein